MNTDGDIFNFTTFGAHGTMVCEKNGFEKWSLRSVYTFSSLPTSTLSIRRQPVEDSNVVGNNNLKKSIGVL